MNLILLGITIIVGCELLFPSYTVYIQKEDGTIVSYGIPKNKEIDLEALVND